MAIKNLCKGNLTNHQWVENEDKVGNLQVHWCGAVLHHMGRYCAWKKFSYAVDQQSHICNKAEERYISYLIILNSRLQHEHLQAHCKRILQRRLTTNNPKSGNLL